MRGTIIALMVASFAIITNVAPTRAFVTMGDGATNERNYADARVVSADEMAENAIDAERITYRPFIECIFGATSYIVVTYAFVGRECRANDGETYFAGVARGEYVTGP